jgi:N-acetylneuraminate synthase/N,N'-diacetyllegionaminate synthase
MEIAGSVIDEDSSFFIAEAGVNHNGDLSMAESLIDAAADAGADAVKFQTFSADRLVTAEASKAAYQEERTDENQSQFEMLREYELDRAAHERLQSYAGERGITFLSTPFDPQSADLLDKLDIPAIKLGSGELTNEPLLTHVAEYGRPIILSTGMGTMTEVQRAVTWIRETNPSVPIAVLHCTSSYPTPLADVNLRAMQRMNEILTEPVGYSDHTMAVETPSFAVAAGASIVEKHFTLNRTLPGPDHEASLEPDDLSKAVSLVRDAGTSRGRAEKTPTDSERTNVETIRKSLHADCDIAEGEKYTNENVSILRPETGLSPAAMSEILGTKAQSSLSAGEPIRKKDVPLEVDDCE